MELEQQRRYARQIMLPEIGEAGQEKLMKARVLIIGAGGLGSALITYLAAAGIGHLGIIDPDRVELSNLARQIIHESGDIGRLKVESAEDRVAELNPEVLTEIYPFALKEDNAEAILRDYDIIADGCDNFATRFLVNRICRKLGKTLVSASIAGFDGQLMTITSHTPCYQCLVSPDAPDANTCRESGVVGPLAGMIGSMQALEVIRTVLEMPAYSGKLMIHQGRTGTSRITSLVRDSACPVCSG